MGVPKLFRHLSERYPLINQPLDSSPSPEFDNLYLDMNGIIHRCSHPDEDSLKNTILEEQIFLNIFNYIDRLFHVVRPQKVFFMAVDGVAPRAKMNQQRQRRFRTAMEAREARELAIKEGKPVPDAETVFDSNCITPGTDFMGRLSVALEFFIRKKVAEDASWRGIDVILSGHEVPGEGEHKIQEYIRLRKSQPDWQPNQSHVVHGLDADLIMLGLATHEPNFCLLREEVLTARVRRGVPLGKETFWVMHLCVLREYLALEFGPKDQPYPFVFDIERIVDDFIVMCFFVGNDFLPNLYGIDIASGAVDTLFKSYKKLLRSGSGYLCDGPNLHLDRIERFIALLSHIEREQLQHAAMPGFYEQEDAAHGPDQDLPAFFDVDDDTTTDPDLEWEDVNKSKPRKRTGVPRPKDLTDEEIWKHHYYASKMHIGVRDARSAVVEQYVQGLCWVQKYYHTGVPSWSWFFAQHYAPLAADLVNLSALNVTLDKSHPFLPFQQLLGVLPPASAKFLPAAYSRMMLSPDSAIADFYPETFDIDMEGKRNAWEGVVLLDFIDEKRLVAASESVNADVELSDVERARNTFGTSWLYRYDPMAEGSLASPFPTLLKDLSPLKSTRVELFLPALPRDFRFKVPEGTGLGVMAPAGFPSLHWRVFDSDLVQNKTNVFGFPSKQPSQVLMVLSSEISHEEAPTLPGKRVWVRWPQMVEAIVQSVIDGEHRWVWRNGKIEATRLSAAERRGIPSAESMAAEMKTAKAVALPLQCAERSVVVQCAVFRGMTTLANGAHVKVFEEPNDAEFFPLTALLPHELFVDPRFVEKPPPPIGEAFAAGTTVVSMAAGANHYGCTGKVLDVRKGQVKVLLTEQPRNEIAAQKVLAQNVPKRIPTYLAARQVGVSTGTLGRLIGDMYLDVGQRRDLQVGLELKSNKDLTIVLGYTDYDEGKWFLTHKAVGLLCEYVRRFPALIRYIETHDYSSTLPQTALIDVAATPGVVRTAAPAIPPLDHVVAMDGPGYARIPVDRKTHLYRLIEDWLLDASRDTLLFATDVEPVERKWLHEVLEETGVSHESQGEGADRCMVARKPGAKAPASKKKGGRRDKGTPVPESHRKVFEEAVQDIQAFLKASPTNNMPRVPAGTLGASPESMEHLELLANQFAADEVRTRTVVFRKPFVELALPLESIDSLVDPGEQFDLGQRVVLISGEAAVPFGARGTVIGVEKRGVDVLFDNRYMGGTSLMGRCSNLRGLRVPAKTLMHAYEHDKKGQVGKARMVGKSTAVRRGKPKPQQERAKHGKAKGQSKGQSVVQSKGQSNDQSTGQSKKRGQKTDSPQVIQVGGVQILARGELPPMPTSSGASAPSKPPKSIKPRQAKPVHVVQEDDASVVDMSLFMPKSGTKPPSAPSAALPVPAMPMPNMPAPFSGATQGPALSGNDIQFLGALMGQNVGASTTAPKKKKVPAYARK